MNLFRVFWVITLLSCFLSFAYASRISISAEDFPDKQGSLEIRSVTLPDGSDLEYFVIKGNPVTLKIDETQQVIAKHIEFDRTTNIIRIIGYGTIITEGQTIQGDNLTFELEQETFSGQDVFIITSEIDVVGIDANRVPGQISVISGEFSPCARCQQDVQDYSFKAGRLELFPGDRLVAFDVQVRIRDFPILYLPLLVVPLGPPDRQPQLNITSGTENSKAEVFLTWPYVAGSSALGSFRVRYYADVDVGQGNFFSNTFLGGAVVTNYLGADLQHRFFTDEGRGSFDLSYTPSFITNEATGEKTDALFKVRFDYATEETLDIQQVRLVLSRDDTIRNRIGEYQLTINNQQSGINGRFSSIGFVDFDPEDDVSGPSFSSPQRSVELELSPEEASFSVGPFTASGLNLNIGFFEARSNSSNRSAATSRLQTAGRILESHSISLDPQRPWAGFELSANTNFQGQYYSTGERLINWGSNATATQRFGIGSLSFSFNRTINEGETPFAFDTRSLGNSSSLGANFSLDPFDWLSFSTATRYTFLNDRSREAEGFDPINTSLRLFNNLSWISLSFNNSYDFSEDSFDPGKLTTELSLRSPDPSVEANLNINITSDLDPDYPDRLGQDNNESELTVSSSFGVRPYLVFDMSGGYVFDPPEPEEGKEVAYRKDLDLGLTFGTDDQQDLIPSLRLGLLRDLNNQETKTLNINATAAIQPVEATLEQSFNVAAKTLGSTNYGVRWNGVAQLEASGFALINPAWLGLELNEDRQEFWQINLSESRSGGESRWRLSYSSTHAFGESSCTGASDVSPEVCNSKLNSFINLDETRIGPFYFGVDFDSSFILKDDSQPLNYLSQAKLVFFTDIASTVGLQGSLQYDATANDTEITRSTLRFDDLALTAKFLDQLYISMILGSDIDGETWVLSNSTGDTRFNFQPEFRLTWDRCCWALYSSWNSATGKISITLTTPGGTEGLGGVFDDTPLRLPGADEEAGS